MEKYNEYMEHLGSIFRVDGIVDEASYEGICWGIGDFTGIEGINCNSIFTLTEKDYNTLQGKYVVGVFSGTMSEGSYFGKTDEDEGVYKDGIIYESSLGIYMYDYVVGTIYYEKITKGENTGEKEYYFKVGNLLFSLGTRKRACENNDYHKIDDRELPMKIKLVGPIDNSEIKGSISIVGIIKDTVEELIKVILEEKGIHPTDKEINEIVKNSAFNPENERKGILNPVYRTEGREVKKVKVYTTYFGNGTKEVKIENLD
ncbi:MAG: hypothetical protein PHS49_07580 [Candidatus Gracilibacteria bacterium]|nr:hypothetical protein [Candidatus Gracilibacteria bacterium]